MKITPAWLTNKRRRRIYDVLCAVALLLVGKGLLTGDEALLWLGIPAAAFGIARDNT